MRFAFPVCVSCIVIFHIPTRMASKLCTSQSMAFLVQSLKLFCIPPLSQEPTLVRLTSATAKLLGVNSLVLFPSLLLTLKCYRRSNQGRGSLLGLTVGEDTSAMAVKFQQQEAELVGHIVYTIRRQCGRRVGSDTSRVTPSNTFLQEDSTP